MEAATDFLALGLAPEKCRFWVQGDVPEHAELTWILHNTPPWVFWREAAPTRTSWPTT
jgi:tryptophanyl-tRNA synthetase